MRDLVVQCDDRHTGDAVNDTLTLALEGEVTLADFVRQSTAFRIS